MNNHMQDFYSKNKTGVIVVVVVVLIIIGYFVFSKKSETTEEGMMNNTPATTIPATTAGATTAGATAGSNGQAVTLSYTQALITYKDRRIQFDASCQATPNTVTYKDNTGIMLDNRTDKALSIKVGTTYTVAAYGFKIVYLPDVYRQSKTLLVDCGKQQNVATVLVQE